MSSQNGPNWYPSKQFTHTPDVPGAPEYTTAAPPSAAKSLPARPSGVRRFIKKLFRRGGTSNSA